MKYSGKKLLLSILIPALAFTAVTGTGFGLWVFNNGDSTDSETKNMSHFLTRVVSYDDLQPVASGTLVLDDFGATFKDIVLTISPVVNFQDQGVSVTYNDEGERTVGTYATDYDVTFVCYITCTIPALLAKYIDCKYVYADQKIQNNEPITCTVPVENCYDSTYIDGDNVTQECKRVKFNFNPEFEWVNHPTTMVAFNQMYDDIETARTTHQNIITFYFKTVKDN